MTGRTLMVAAFTSEGAPLPGACLAARFTDDSNEVARMVTLLKRQVRSRFPEVDGSLVHYDVYEVVPSTGGRGSGKNAGWPRWLGEAAYYS